VRPPGLTLRRLPERYLIPPGVKVRHALARLQGNRGALLENRRDPSRASAAEPRRKNALDSIRRASIGWWHRGDARASAERVSRGLRLPHRHFTFSLPKILRHYFLYDRILLSDLSHCAWESLKTFLATVFLEQDAMIGAVIAIQTFGDFLNFNPHCHVLCTDGTFFGSGSFKLAAALDTEPLEKIFQHKVLGMLLGSLLLVLKLVAPTKRLTTLRDL